MHPSETKGAVTVRLKGGLGNQMFQYAMGRAISLRSGMPLWLDTSMFGLVDRNRTYALAPYRIEARVTRLSLWSLGAVWLRGRYYREKTFTCDPGVASVSPGTVLMGNFQSEKYFLAEADAVRKDLSLREPLSGRAEKHLEEINAVALSVAVHVRRDDYVSDQKTSSFHGNCSWEYYENAMRLMRERLVDVRFFFFSDEPDWLAAQQVRGIIVSGLSPHEDMFLMSRCAHQIIANSSFSWWGAWLNRNPDKVVVAPRRWFANEYYEQQTGDLIPEGWIRL